MSSICSGPPLATTTTDDEQEMGTAVVEAVAAISDTAPMALPQLDGVIDSDALDSLFARSDTAGLIEFGYHEYGVRIHADDRITVHDLKGAE